MTMTITQDEEQDGAGGADVYGRLGIDAEPGADGTATAGRRDEADLALARQMLRSLRGREDERRSKVERLREAIRSNSYENPLKLSVAIDRLVEKAQGQPDAGQ